MKRRFLKKSNMLMVGKFDEVYYYHTKLKKNLQGTVATNVDYLSILIFM